MEEFTEKRNINFMVFDALSNIIEYLNWDLVWLIKERTSINVAIETHNYFYGLYNQLKDAYKNGHVSFQNTNFFLTHDYVYDFSGYDVFLNDSNATIFKNMFLVDVDFNYQNLHYIIKANDFEKYLTGEEDFSVYDNEIEAYNGIDVFVLKMNPDGSLLLNQKVNQTNLFSHGELIIDTAGVTKQPVAYATIGIDQILKSKKIYLIAVGSENAASLQKLFYTKDLDKNLPVCLLKSHPNIVVLADKQASVGIFSPSHTEFVASTSYLEPVKQEVNAVIDPIIETTKTDEQIVEETLIETEVIKKIDEQPIEEAINETDVVAKPIDETNISNEVLTPVIEPVEDDMFVDENETTISEKTADDILNDLIAEQN